MLCIPKNKLRRFITTFFKKFAFCRFQNILAFINSATSRPDKRFFAWLLLLCEYNFSIIQNWKHHNGIGAFQFFKKSFCSVKKFLLPLIDIKKHSAKNFFGVIRNWLF